MTRKRTSINRHHTSHRRSGTDQHRASHRGNDLHVDDVARFVERTTASSNVPLFVDDLGVIEQIAAVLS